MNTRLLYHYDSLNLNNFHDYIDEHPHLVVVIKLTNGMILCGYSTEPFIKGQINYGSGFIASLTNECLYFMDDRKNNKLTTYDPFFIIFGNSEIRLKIPETKVYSNLGIVNRCFQTNEKTPEKLFGSPERDNEAEQYEIYSVYFDSFWSIQLYYIMYLYYKWKIHKLLSLCPRRAPWNSVSLRTISIGQMAVIIAQRTSQIINIMVGLYIVIMYMWMYGDGNKHQSIMKDIENIAFSSLV